MKRSDINFLIASASKCFQEHGWALPPQPRWDVTDFGLGDWRHFGVLLLNLAEQPEYCEKLMYAQAGMITLAHCHRKKKEDIIARWGKLAIQVWADQPGKSRAAALTLQVNGLPRQFQSGDIVVLNPGWRITITPGVYHEFHPVTEECIIGEVSTANDDVHDNYFVRPDLGRFPPIEEDEPPLARLLSEA